MVYISSLLSSFPVILGGIGTGISILVIGRTSTVSDTELAIPYVR